MPAVPQGGSDAVGDLRERVLRTLPGGDQGLGALVLLRVQDREDEVLEFRLECLHAEAFGERDEYVPRDLGDPGLLLGPHDAEGAHVVQPVGEFDRHDTDVVPGGDEHLAEGLGLGGGPVVDLLELGDAVDQVTDLVAELLPHLIEGHLGVLDRVVEQRGGQGRRLGAELGEDQGDGEGVGDVRLTALAHLAAVGGLGEDVGLAQDGQVGVGVVRAVRVRHVPDGVGEPVTGDRPEQGDTAQLLRRSIRARPRLRRGAPGLAASALMGAPPATSTGREGMRIHPRAGA